MKKYKMKINQKDYEAKILEYSGSDAKVEVNGVEFIVEFEKDHEMTPTLVRSNKVSQTSMKKSAPKPSGSSPGDVVAPIPGTVHSIKVEEGDKVSEGDIVLILEAMKMESDIATNHSGTVKKINVAVGDSVQEGQILIQIGD